MFPKADSGNVKVILLILFCLLTSITCLAQSDYKAIIRDKSAGNQPLTGVNVSVEGTSIGATSDLNGLVVIKNIPAGERTLRFSFVGYKNIVLDHTFPLKGDQPEEVFMEPSEELLNEVIISSVRTQRSVADIPVRIEAISGEELNEKLSVKTSDITKLLTEATGIQVQQTSAFSGSSVIRMQGLDGKYTQILKDGYPLYESFSGSLSILQIPPLDLSQVEIIKGSASTLYGGGAIAGLVNLISKVPHKKPEFDLILNTSNRASFNGSSYYSGRNDKTGVSLLLNYDDQKAYDVNGDSYSDIPKVTSFSVNPRLFYYPDSSTALSLAISQFYESRKGGLMSYIENSSDPSAAFEFNTSRRISTQLGLTKKFGSNIFTIKNSFSFFNREVEIKNGYFQAKQMSTFTEANYLLRHGLNDLVFGLDFRTDHVRPGNNLRPAYITNGLTGSLYSNSTLGLFAQYDLNLTPKLIIEPGFRLDYNVNENFYPLPSLYAIYKFNSNFSTRVGGGLGYKLPAIFSQEDENLFRLITVNNNTSLKAERSYGGGIDFNYHGNIIEGLTLQINQSFYLTNIENPVIIRPSYIVGPISQYYFENAAEPYNTSGFETNLSLSMEDVYFFMGYHYSHALRKFEPVNIYIPLNPVQSFWLDFSYEEEGEFRAAFEAYYTGKQYLENGSQTKPYWSLGILAEKTITDYLNIFVNLENLTDTRLDKLNGSPNNTDLSNIFSNEIWAPQEGFVINGGFRLKL